MPSQASDLAAAPTKTGVLKSKPQFRNLFGAPTDDAARAQTVHAWAEKLTYWDAWVGFF